MFLTEGDRVRLTKPHPWAGATGRLVRYETYGPNGMFEGWRIRLDETDGHECYAQPEKLKRIK